MMDHIEKFRGTTILMVRRGDKVAVAGDGQVSLGDMVMKHKAQKVRRLYHGKIVAGFAGSAADALTLFERLEIEAGGPPGQPDPGGGGTGQGLAHRPDSAAPGGHAADRGRQRLLSHSGTGDVIEPDEGVMAIGSGGAYALAAARALMAHTSCCPRDLPGGHDIAARCVFIPTTRS